MNLTKHTFVYLFVVYFCLLSGDLQICIIVQTFRRLETKSSFHLVFESQLPVFRSCMNVTKQSFVCLSLSLFFLFTLFTFKSSSWGYIPVVFESQLQTLAIYTTLNKQASVCFAFFFSQRIRKALGNYVSSNMDSQVFWFLTDFCLFAYLFPRSLAGVEL
jgi:hypothetical protein